MAKFKYETSVSKGVLSLSPFVTIPVIRRTIQKIKSIMFVRIWKNPDDEEVLFVTHETPDGKSKTYEMENMCFDQDSVKLWFTKEGDKVTVMLEDEAIGNIPDEPYVDFDIDEYFKKHEAADPEAEDTEEAYPEEEAEAEDTEAAYTEEADTEEE